MLPLSFAKSICCLPHLGMHRTLQCGERKARELGMKMMGLCAQQWAWDQSLHSYKPPFAHL